MFETIEDFQKAYHNYETNSFVDALEEAIKIGWIEKTHKAIPIKLMDKWCLMIDTAAQEIVKMGLHQ